jgi:hypothetical protein
MAANLKAIAREMAKVAADTVKARVQVDSGDPDQQRIFLAWLSQEISEDTAISLCRRWAPLIRRSLPERHDDWAAIISVILPLGRTLGVYCMGWTGHEDEWRGDEEDDSDLADPQEWEVLYHRLYDYLRVHGTSDSQGRGDYFLFDEWSGYADQSFTIYRIEFLTPDLVSGVQGILTDGYAHWCVYVVLDLIPPVEGIGSDGLEIHADRVVEKWNRTLLTERLGTRLRF